MCPDIPRSDPLHLVQRLHQTNESKILFVIADGLGGIAGDRAGTELEVANTPHLDRIAREGTTGLLEPVAPGITCGSGPGHLALFGYDPVEYEVGRGVLSALGIGFELRADDVAARGNFCTIDERGLVLDRRAGRISTELGAELAGKLARSFHDLEQGGVQLLVEPEREYRFLLVLRGAGLGANVSDTDPQRVGVPPRDPCPRDAESRRTAEIVTSFIERAHRLLVSEHPANMVLLRGFAHLPAIGSIGERYGVRGCAIAGYPMYRGIARLLGMATVAAEPELDRELEALRAAWSEHDFFFLHYKAPDSAAEDGDFDRKVHAIEELDRVLPRLLDLRPDVLVVTGDHSSPSQLASHSWHAVPVVLSARTCRRDAVTTFGETACAGGGLGRLPTKYLMALALAHAGRLAKYGA